MKNELIIASKERNHPRSPAGGTNARERAAAILREFNIEELGCAFAY